MAKTYTTKTASLKATTADIRILNINGNPFSKVVSDNIPESPTPNDIWKYAATTDENGVVTITDDVTVDYAELTNDQKNITKTAIKVIDNKVLDANDALLMNWDTKNFTNENNSSMFSIFNGSSTLTEWDSDLSSLTNGNYMFAYSSLASFNGDLSNLTDGNWIFAATALTSFDVDLPSLTNSNWMFAYTALTSFDVDLSSVTNGRAMFYQSALESFSSDLSNLTNGDGMFGSTALTSFNSELPSLTDGERMFYKTTLQSFNGDLSNLTDGERMFYSTALESFNGDLSSLIYGYGMLANNQPRHYGIRHFKIVDGTKKQVIETFVSNGLKSFISNLSSLKSGYQMFGSGSNVTYEYTNDGGASVTETTNDVTPLDEESIMLIADTINNISSLDKTVDNNWTYTTCDSNGNLTTKTISSSQRGILHLGYDATTITDTTNIMKYCDKIADKGWTVYLNGSLQTANNGAIETIPLTDENGSPIAIPYYYKHVQVSEDVAEYVDQNGNYYIIIGGQHVFGDNISTYGMFTSYQHAVQEITTGLGLTKYEKPSTENSDNN